MTQLVVLCGLPGVGKSTVARDLADELDADVLRTDAIRKDLRAEPRYDGEETRRVYARMLDQARAALESGTDVVLDGTFQRARHRRWAESLAESTGSGFEVVRVRCDESVAVERITDRDPDVSDASRRTYYQLMESFEDLALDHVTIDNSRSREATRRQVAELCEERLSDS